MKLKTKIKKFSKEIFLLLAKLTKTNLIHIAYYQKGILIFGDNKITGEYYFVKDHLKNMTKEDNPIFFDIGSNKNDYSNMLLEFFDEPTIYAFEANPNIFSKNEQNDKIKNYNLALGSEEKDVLIYDYKNNPNSSHSSLYKEVLTDIHHDKNVSEIKTKMKTLDSFCQEKEIDYIDFIKIDTEGNEFDILKGARKMIDQNKIKVIQFEFNEMNIVSRVFLKDFYDLLKNYNFYRIKGKNLIPLGEYKTENEIFKFQNIVAINKNID